MSLEAKLKRVENAGKQNLTNQVCVNSKESAETSKFFATHENKVDLTPKSISELFLDIVNRINPLLRQLKFSNPVTYIYNPTEYAYIPLSLYIQRYCNDTKKIMFLGMNPGPWGMSQTGIPFGEVSMVRDWLGISGQVQKPEKEAQSRQITGFDCHRSEVSGKRFWGLFQEICGTPEKFFKHAFIYNYCPLALMKSNGANITPSDLKGSESKILTEICDKALCEVISLLKVEIIVGVGRYAEKRANCVIKDNALNNVTVQFLLHPSPRVIGNENWQQKAKDYLTNLNLLDYFC